MWAPIVYEDGQAIDCGSQRAIPYALPWVSLTLEQECGTMHVNNRKPNILQDMQSGRNLRDLNRDGTPKPSHVAKVYPYSSKRQNTRAMRKAGGQ